MKVLRFRAAYANPKFTRQVKGSPKTLVVPDRVETVRWRVREAIRLIELWNTTTEQHHSRINHRTIVLHNCEIACQPGIYLLSESIVFSHKITVNNCLIYPMNKANRRIQTKYNILRENSPTRASYPLPGGLLL